MRFAGVLEELNNQEAVSGHPLNRLDEVGSQVQPVAGFLVLACSHEGLELRMLFARREAEVRPHASNVFENGNVKSRVRESDLKKFTLPQFCVLALRSACKTGA